MLPPDLALLLNLAAILLGCAWNVYCYVSAGMAIMRALGRERSRTMNLLWYWSKWPALGYVFANPICDLLIDGDMNWWQGLLVAITFFVWWVHRDSGDDDDHKKLKKKLKEKITEIQGKLVVVPEPA